MLHNLHKATGPVHPVRQAAAVPHTGLLAVLDHPVHQAAAGHHTAVPEGGVPCSVRPDLLGHLVVVAVPCLGRVADGRMVAEGLAPHLALEAVFPCLGLVRVLPSQALEVDDPCFPAGVAVHRVVGPGAAGLRSHLVQWTKVEAGTALAGVGRSHSACSKAGVAGTGLPDQGAGLVAESCTGWARRGQVLETHTDSYHLDLVAEDIALAGLVDVEAAADHTDWGAVAHMEAAVH